MKRAISILLSIVLIVSIAATATLSAAADDISTIKKYYGYAWNQINKISSANPYSSMEFMTADSKTYGDFYYKISKGKACITGYSGKKLDITIPAKIGKYAVDGICMYAFGTLDCSPNYKSVSIPSSVTFIDSDAFANCTGISKITGAAGLTHVGERAFTDTKWYKSQKNGVVYLGKMALGYKGTIPAKITIKDGTVGIADFAFIERNKTAQTKIVIPASVKKIGAAPFGFYIGKKGYVKISGYTVYAPANSAAQTYAKQCSLTFKKYNYPATTTLLATPMIMKFKKASAAAVNISIGQVKGAYGYVVFKKVSGKWKSIGKTTKTVFVDKTVKKGVKYYYTVRCINKSGQYVSKYNTTGWWYKHS